MPEKTDIRVRGLLIGVAIIVAGIAASLLLSAVITARVDTPATGPSAGQPPKTEGAALQTDASRDLRSFLREKRARLASYGRVDEGHVHIPIERAMRIMARGRER